jgi:hypothetical protein
MRRVILLLTMMAATLVVASGVALAVNKIGTNGPDTFGEPMEPTIFLAMVVRTSSSPSAATTTTS